MFNIKKHKTAQIASYEKYLRENTLGPESKKEVTIHEKQLNHKSNPSYTTTEDQMASKHTANTSEQVVEKKLNTEKSDYVNHRADNDALYIPPISALVEKIRQERLAKDYKPVTESHWSQTFNEKKQQGALPKTPKNVGQHNKIVLNNDPSRFGNPTSDPLSANKNIKPLVGNITTADVDKISHGIKTGATTEYDTAIMAILRLAHDERRELTNIERKTIVNLKVARNNKLLKC